MKLKIEEIYSRNMFPGLIIGKPKEGHYEESLKHMENLLGNDLPIFNISETKWTQLTDTDGKNLGYGSWGHITGVKCCISEEYDRHSFSIIFNFLPEKEKIEDKINEVISNIDWKSGSLKWDIGDL